MMRPWFTNRIYRVGSIILEPDKVIVGDDEEFGCVNMDDFLNELAKQVITNTNAYDNYMRIFVNKGEVPKIEAIDNALRVNTLFKYIQVRKIFSFEYLLVFLNW